MKMKSVSAATHSPAMRTAAARSSSSQDFQILNLISSCRSV